MKNIKNWNEFTRVNELDTQTYAKVMQRTEGYPMRLTFSGDKNLKPNPKGEQEGRVNRLAHERFESEFKKEFPPKVTTITMNGAPFEFVNIRFVNNYGSYYLIFEEMNGSGRLYVHRHRDNKDDSYFIDYNGMKYYSEDGETGLNPESEELILNMLKYTGSTTSGM